MDFPPALPGTGGQGTIDIHLTGPPQDKDAI